MILSKWRFLVQKFGNIGVSEIIRMRIEAIGIDAFNDTEFFHTKNEPEWRNFQQKIIHRKHINIENIITAEIRIKKLLAKINYLLYGLECPQEITRGTAADEEIQAHLQEIYDSFNEEQKISVNGAIIIPSLIFGFLDQLQKNISTVVPCDIPQDKIANWTLVKYLSGRLGFAQRVCGEWVRLRSNEERTKCYEDVFHYYFKKNSEGLYVPSLSEINKAIKTAFKKAGKNLDALKAIVDTDKQNSLTNVSTSWKTLKKLLINSDEVFAGVDRNTIIQYKSGYVAYYLLIHFRNAIKCYISEKQFSKIIEGFIDNMSYFKSLRDYHFGEENPAKKKIPETSTEFIIYEDETTLYDISDKPHSTLGDFKIDYFYYDRKSPNDMKPILSFISQKKYIDEIVKRTNSYGDKYSFDSDSFSKEDELFYLEKLCSEDKIGNSAPFFFKWYSARIEYALYKNKLSEIGKVSSAYIDAYDSGIYFTGKYLKTFMQEAIRIFLEEYKTTKRVGRIKEVYKHAAALGLTLQLYDDFKDAGFNDPVIHPYEWIFELWDSGYDVIDISQMSGLTWQEIRSILMENQKFLKRNDAASLNDLGRYITKWDCDEYGIDTDDDWD